MNLCVLDVGIQLGLVRKGGTVNQGVWRARRSCALSDVWRECLIVILDVQHPTKAKLLDIAKAGCLPCLLACLCKDWEENGCENRDDGDDDEELNERESALFSFGVY